ncbi:MAG: DUF368 domain-containing protein [Candidatus Omnitrophica bacterium]|nr:DUF368 domain-containing protein [Candidatus Omnitrophota bacterium]
MILRGKMSVVVFLCRLSARMDGIWPNRKERFLMKKSISETLVLLLKGGGIGIANIIPGVSGGTIAVVLGIYDRLIEAISKFFERPEKRGEYVLLLFRVFFGAVVAVGLLAKVMDVLLKEYFHETMFLFMGLILGGIPSVVRSHGDMKIRTSRILAFIVGMILVLGISLIGEAKGQGQVMSLSNIEGVGPYLMLLIGGFFAGGAMIVPGVSGSFILVLLGQYAVVIAAIKDFALKPIGAVSLGAIAGIIIFSRIIEFCLERIPSKTYYFILGLIFASFYKIFPGKPDEAISIFYCSVVFIGGTALSYFVSRLNAD